MFRINVRMEDVIMSLSNVIDMISPQIIGHHKRVAYIAYSIAEEMNLPQKDKETIVIAGLLHDIGALSLQERIDLMKFECTDAGEHCRAGYFVLREFPPLRDAADIIRFHHNYWNNGVPLKPGAPRVPIHSHILHLADRIDVLINENMNILAQEENIYHSIEIQKNKMFMPEAVDAFKVVKSRESFWLYMSPYYINTKLMEELSRSSVSLSLDDVLSFSKMFGYLIDFKSRFTATHSSGVSAVAVEIAKLMNFADDEIKMIEVAGNLHDIGKLAVPTEILEKPTSLDFYEFSSIRSHTFHTYNILKPLKGFEIINEWASYHHEGLTGSGYPFHIKGENINLGSRIITVADIFTALTEERPYRKGMAEAEVDRIFVSFIIAGHVDQKVYDVLKENFEKIDAARRVAQENAQIKYSEFRNAISTT